MTESKEQKLNFKLHMWLVSCPNVLHFSYLYTYIYVFFKLTGQLKPLHGNGICSWWRDVLTPQTHWEVQVLCTQLLLAFGRFLFAIAVVATNSWTKAISGVLFWSVRAINELETYTYIVFDWVVFHSEETWVPSYFPSVSDCLCFLLSVNTMLDFMQLRSCSPLSTFTP